jgi:flagella basal body P-ring formation protein FlgA
MFLGLISILFSFTFGHNSSFDAHLKKYLDEKFSSYIKYEYQIMSMPKNFSKIEINVEKNASITKNYIYVPINVYDSKNFVSTSLLTVRVKLFKNVFVARQEIRRGGDLSQNLFQVKEADISMNDNKTFDVQHELTSFRSRVLIKEGTVLSDNMIEPIPIVKKGDNLILHTTGTGVDVSVEVVARQDGCAGDVISVHAQGSKLYKAKIVDKKNLILVE